MHEIAFVVEYAAAARMPPSVRARIVKHRVPKFGVVAQKCAQIVANRPDIPVPHQVRAALPVALARPDDGAQGMRASLGTVTRRESDGAAVKRPNDTRTRHRITRLANVVRRFAPETTALVLDPLVEESRLESEKAKNDALRRAFDRAPGIVVPRVWSSSPTEVVMDYVDAVLVKDLEREVPLDVVERMFRTVVWRMLSSGVVHCDLHAANIGITTSSATGNYGSPGRSGGGRKRFVLFDFGSVRTVPALTVRRTVIMRALRDLVECVALDDWDGALKVLKSQGIVTRGAPDQMRELAMVSVEYARGSVDLAGMRPVFEKIGGDVAMAPGPAALVSAIVTLEATCKRLNADFTIVGAMP